MADSTSVEASPQDLTDDQIQQLLLEAETRLRGPNAVAPVDDLASIRIPKLSTGSSLEAYVRQGDDAATVNAAMIADPAQKKLANSLHPAGKKDVKVSYSILHLLPFPSCCEENFPNAKRLIRRQQSVLGCAVLVRAIYNHSYSEHLITILSSWCAMYDHSLTNATSRKNKPLDLLGSTFPRLN